jgi:glycosyltransferase involved in cell wall biosynthesis
MRVLLITGSYPPAVCGIGDYTAVLERHLRALGLDVGVFHDCDWSSAATLAAARAVRAHRADLYHLQYPTLGYGRSVAPSLLPLLVRTAPFVVTTHEFSIFRTIRRPWFLPFAARARLMIFTNEKDRDAFQRYAPWSRAERAVIPIGSNIPAAPPQPREARRVTYFGQLAPQKGLEHFLALARLNNQRNSGYRLTILGGVPGRYRDYAQTQLAAARELGIETILDRPAPEVAERLARTTYCYLPFIDGASVKRGSLLAALTNKAIVLTTHSDITPDWLRQATVETTGPDHALGELDRLEQAAQARNAIQAQLDAVGPRFAWDDIAQHHLALYRRILAARAAA